MSGLSGKYANEPSNAAPKPQTPLGSIASRIGQARGLNYSMNDRLKAIINRLEGGESDGGKGNQIMPVPNGMISVMQRDLEAIETILSEQDELIAKIESLI